MADVISELTNIGKIINPYLAYYLKKDASEEFLDVILHQVNTGGKRIRPALTLLCCEIAGGKLEKAIPAAVAVELIHNYSLIIDDIIDRGEIRRGKPTTRKLYGDTMALLAGLHYREAVINAVNDCMNSLKIHEILSKAIKELIDGERLDVLFEQAGRYNEYIIKHRRKYVSLSEYLDMISKKTAALIKASCIVGGLVANAPQEVIFALEKFGENIGLAFQIIDDLLDIFGESKVFGKQIGKDIIEHKLGNIIVILALEELEGNDKEKLLEILRKEKIKDEDLKTAMALIRKTNAKDKALRMAREYAFQAVKALEKLPQCNAKEKLIKLANFIIERQF